MTKAYLSFLCLLLFLPSLAVATTGVDLSERIVIDGYSSDFILDESLFTIIEKDVNGDGILDRVPQERTDDSKWGFHNDINQIKVTWDADNIYFAVDGVSWDNNILLLFDFQPGGLDKMTELTSWRRNFVFSNDFFPDLFWATWDGNATPQMWRYESENTVKQIEVTTFETVATFAQGNLGRSMEVRIPWPVFYGEELTRSWDETIQDSVYILLDLPDGHDAARSIRLAAILTAGPDGTGGPDSAPDNFSGHTIESSDQVVIDNYAIVPVDLTYYILDDSSQVFDSTGLSDRVIQAFEMDDSPDLGANIQSRRSFLAEPPFDAISFSIDQIHFSRPTISPEDGLNLDFKFTVDPPVSADKLRNVKLTAEIFNMNGRLIRVLYREEERNAGELEEPEMDSWDGCDGEGRMVPGGIYILRLVVEPGINSQTKAFSVVR